jgi:hypothetical protein
MRLTKDIAEANKQHCYFKYYGLGIADITTDAS